MARPAPVNCHPNTEQIAMADSTFFRYSPVMKSVSVQLQHQGAYVSKLLKITVLPVAMALCHSASWASDSSTAALRVLLGANETSLQATSTTAAQVTDNTQRKTITVMRGESLDRVIRRAMPGMPLHPDFLRQAFVRVNPQVFPKGAAHAMRTGTPLQVPTPDELRFMLLSQHPESAHLFQLPESAKASEPEPAQARRHWVRYP